MVLPIWGRAARDARGRMSLPYTAGLQAFFSAIYGVDMARGDTCEVAIGEDGVAHVAISVTAKGYVDNVQCEIRFAGEDDDGQR